MLNARLTRGGPWLAMFCAAAVGVVIGAALLVRVRLEVTSLRYEQGELLRARESLTQSTERLRLEEAARTSPERLEPAARALGLQHPEPGQIVFLEPSREAVDVAAGPLR